MKKTFIILICLLPWLLCAQNGISTEDEPLENEQLILDIDKLNERLQPIIDRGDVLEEEIKAQGTRIYDDEKYRDEIIARFDELRLESLEVMKQFAREHPDSEVSLHVVAEMLKANADFNELDKLFGSLAKEISESDAGKKLKAEIDKTQVTAIGSVAPGFIQTDMNSNPVSLEEFRGKYVLVDFWASWCEPCRKEYPSLTKTYKKFKDKNFDIVSVSLDNQGERQAWLKAIKKDKLTWTQLSDLEGWQNSIALQYGITAIPQNFLIDPDGIIIARNLRGEALIEKLTEILE